MSRDAETRETHVMEFPVYWRTEVAFGGDRRQQGRVVRSDASLAKHCFPLAQDLALPHMEFPRSRVSSPQPITGPGRELAVSPCAVSGK
ncbi:hypothetical protein RRG08_033060 [Elysia crispata]|uniref:Uncharacterized protein n=1 Tax=Elysia crispata TaxID=231223 RepID=A0AAE1A6X6_9GAST|nr:hypothetical protein RRG08_033060 [Elysia crispata]